MNVEETKFPVAPVSKRMTAGWPLTVPVSLSSGRATAVICVICELASDGEGDAMGDMMRCEGMRCDANWDGGGLR